MFSISAQPDDLNEHPNPAQDSGDVQPRRVVTSTTYAKLTDLGNANRFMARHEELVRYVHATGRWHVWDGKAWAVDDTGQIERYAHDTVRFIQRQAQLLPEGSKEQEAMAKHAGASENAPKLAAMIKLAQALEPAAVRADAFDAHPWELNTHSGIVDLRTGELGHHDPARMHSQITAVAYRPDARAPQWEAFLRRVLPDDDVRDYVQRLLARSLVGAPMPGHEVPFLQGPGGTGKSTLLETVLDVLGGYGRVAPRTLLAPKHSGGSGSTYDVAAIRGARLVLVDELEGPVDGGTLKLVSAAPTLAARQIRERELTATNVASLWMTSNNQPRLDGVDTGLRRRIKVVAMDSEVLDGPGYVGPLKAHIAAHEREGVLAWLVRGCVAASEDDGLVAPAAVERATSETMEAADPMHEWFEASCIRDPNGEATGSELHASYIDWCEHARPRVRVQHSSPKSPQWAGALKALGLDPFRTKTARGWRGARLIQPRM